MAHCSICNQDFSSKAQLKSHINYNLKHSIFERKSKGLELNCYQQAYLLDHYWEQEIKTCRVCHIPFAAENSF